MTRRIASHRPLFSKHLQPRIYWNTPLSLSQVSVNYGPGDAVLVCWRANTVTGDSVFCFNHRINPKQTSQDVLCLFQRFYNNVIVYLCINDLSGNERSLLLHLHLFKFVCLQNLLEGGHFGRGPSGCRSRGVMRGHGCTNGLWFFISGAERRRSNSSFCLPVQQALPQPTWDEDTHRWIPAMSTQTRLAVIFTGSQCTFAH